jgi:hypothetical protein
MVTCKGKIPVSVVSKERKLKPEDGLKVPKEGSNEQLAETGPNSGSKV